jgi:hypothetical protein
MLTGYASPRQHHIVKPTLEVPTMAKKKKAKKAAKKAGKKKKR